MKWLRQGLAPGLALGLAAGLASQVAAQERARPDQMVQRCPGNPASQRLDCSDGVIRPETTGPGGIIVPRPGAPVAPAPAPPAPGAIINVIPGWPR